MFTSSALRLIPRGNCQQYQHWKRGKGTAGKKMVPKATVRERGSRITCTNMAPPTDPSLIIVIIKKNLTINSRDKMTVLSF